MIKPKTFKLLRLSFYQTNKNRGIASRNMKGFSANVLRGSVNGLIDL